MLNIYSYQATRSWLFSGTFQRSDIKQKHKDAISNPHTIFEKNEGGKEEENLAYFSLLQYLWLKCPLQHTVPENWPSRVTSVCFKQSTCHINVKQCMDPTQTLLRQSKSGLRLTENLSVSGQVFKVESSIQPGLFKAH